MEYILFTIVALVFVLIYFKVTDIDNERELKISIITILLVSGLFYFIMDEVKNPSISNNYLGKVFDKRIETTTETYKCGDRTCTRTKKEYFIYSHIRKSKTCKQEVGMFTYDKINLNDLVNCSQSLPNYMLLDKEKFKTTESIKERFYTPKRASFDLVAYRNIYIKDDLPVNKMEINKAIKNFVDNKPYVIQLILTDEKDIDFIAALKDKWNGVNPEEILLIYSIDKETGKVEWAKIETHADNDENEFFVASFNSRHLQRPKFNVELLTDDLNFIDQNYKNIDLYKYQNLSESYNTATKNWVMIIAIVILGIVLTFMHFVFEPKYSYRR